MKATSLCEMDIISQLMTSQTDIYIHHVGFTNGKIKHISASFESIRLYFDKNGNFSLQNMGVAGLLLPPSVSLFVTYGSCSSVTPQTPGAVSELLQAGTLILPTSVVLGCCRYE